MASMVAVLLLMLLMLLLMLLLLPAAAAAVGAANAEAPSRAANGQDVPRAFFCAFFCLFWSSVDTPGVFNAKSAWCCACDCAPVVRVHLASGAAKEPATAPCVRGCLEVEEAGPVTPLSLFRRCLDAPNNPPNQDCLRALSVRTMVANAFGRGRGGVYRLYRQDYRARSFFSPGADKDRAIGQMRMRGCECVRFRCPCLRTVPTLQACQLSSLRMSRLSRERSKRMQERMYSQH